MAFEAAERIPGYILYVYFLCILFMSKHRLTKYDQKIFSRKKINILLTNSRLYRNWQIDNETNIKLEDRIKRSTNPRNHFLHTQDS